MGKRDRVRASGKVIDLMEALKESLTITTRCGKCGAEWVRERSGTCALSTVHASGATVCGGVLEPVPSPTPRAVESPSSPRSLDTTK